MPGLIANNIESLGGSIKPIKNIVAKVNSISDLLNIDTSKLDDKEQFHVLGFHEPNDGGGGIFYWDANEDKSNHNGGTIISPDAIFPSDWSDTNQQETWFTSGGTGNGCWKRVIGDYVTPEMFGAKGDGVTDDTLSLNTLTNSVNKVVLQDKIYFITSPVVLKSNFYLLGRKELSTIKVSGDIHAVKAEGSDENELVNITIKGIKIIGHDEEVSASKGLSSGIYFNYVKNSEISFVNVVNASNRGVFIAHCNNVVVFGNVIESCGLGYTSESSGGEGIFLSESTKCKVIFNYLYNTGRHSIGLFATSEYIVKGNIIVDSNRHGVSVSGGTSTIGYLGKHGIIEGNQIKNANDKGILIENTADYTNIRGNIIDGSVEMGIMLSDGSDGDGCAYCIIADNIVQNILNPVNDDGGGILVLNSPKCIISSNTIENTASYGIRVSGVDSEGTLVDNNSICNTDLTGLFLYSTKNIKVSKNNCIDVGGHGINIQGTTDSLIESNIVLIKSSGTEAYGIYLRDNSINNIICNNYVNDEQETPTLKYGIRADTGSTKNNIYGNNIMNVANSKYYFEESNNNMLFGLYDNEYELWTLTSSVIFSLDNNKIHLVDANGADRNFNPSGYFPSGYMVVIKNISSGTYNITFDSDGIAEIIGQGQTGQFMYDGNGWVKLFVI